MVLVGENASSNNEASYTDTTSRRIWQWSRIWTGGVRDVSSISSGTRRRARPRVSIVSKNTLYARSFILRRCQCLSRIRMRMAYSWSVADSNAFGPIVRCIVSR